MAPLAVGDSLPSGTVFLFEASGGMKKVDLGEWAKGRKVVVFGVPGAYTPTCSTKHLPGFIEKAGELKKLGVEAIACFSVNDPFVMREWGKGYSGLEGAVEMFADGDASVTKALGFEVDLSDHGLGLRSRRFSLVADNGMVTVLHLEEGGDFASSSAEDLVKELASASA